MSVALYGWIEARIARWEGCMRLDALVPHDRVLFDCLFQSMVRSGLRALQYEFGIPGDVSVEMRALLDEFGIGPGAAFHIPGDRLAQLPWSTRMSWPRVDLELYWRDPSTGAYVLKSKSHTTSRLESAELLHLLDSAEAYDKHQYRYRVVRSDVEIDVAEDWLSLFTLVQGLASRYGAHNVRMIGFFG